MNITELKINCNILDTLTTNNHGIYANEDLNI